jgi:hypothetical protein
VRPSRLAFFCAAVGLELAGRFFAAVIGITFAGFVTPLLGVAALVAVFMFEVLLFAFAMSHISRCYSLLVYVDALIESANRIEVIRCRN